MILMLLKINVIIFKMTFLLIFGLSGLPEKPGVSGLFNKHFNVGAPFMAPAGSMNRAPTVRIMPEQARGNKYII